MRFLFLVLQKKIIFPLWNIFPKLETHLSECESETRLLNSVKLNVKMPHFARDLKKSQELKKKK